MPENAVEVARKFLRTFDSHDFDKWAALVADDAVVNFPFAPPGIPKRYEGRAVFEQNTRGMFSGIEKFTYHDLVLHGADDPELVFGTARSEALIKGGKVYRNQYCFLIRVRNGRIVEHNEYFDPQAITATFGPLG